MEHFVIVRRGIINESGDFEDAHKGACQFPQPDSQSSWHLWADICTGYHLDLHWKKKKHDFIDPNGVRSFSHRDMPSIVVEVSVIEVP